MIGFGAYLLSAAALVAVVLSLGFSAYRLRRRLLPTWEGAPARLVESIVGIALLIWLSEILGTFNLFYAWSLVSCSLLLATLVFWQVRAGGTEALGASPAGGRGEGGRGRPRPQRPPPPLTGPAAERSRPSARSSAQGKEGAPRRQDPLAWASHPWSRWLSSPSSSPIGA